MQQNEAFGPMVNMMIQDGIAVVTIDNPPVNAGSRDVRQGLLDAVGAIDAREEIAAVILIGAGKTFIAGSDIKEFDGPIAPPEMPKVIAAIEACRKPVVAAIHGASLGGGFEIALGCDGRIATSDALVGLPEVTLGMIPGAGGTQRLPRLTGLTAAIELITSGRRVAGPEALKLGMIDAIADGDLRSEAIAFARGLNGEKRRLSEAAVPTGDESLIENVEAAALKAGRGAPAIRAAIDTIHMAKDLPFTEALASERAVFQQLRNSREAAALRHLFFAEREAARGSEGVKPRSISSVGIVGLGTMGRGIAAAFALAGIDVAVTEQSEELLGKGVDGIRATFDELLKRGRLDAAEHAAAVDRIRPVTSLAGIGDVDLALEAVIEDMAAKQDVLRRLDAVLKPDAILATNTSYLDIDVLAAATSRPASVAGLHFFSPAHIMKLVEVIRAGKTSDAVIATLLSLAKRLGKIPVQARVGEGFIGNRILSAYRAECEYMLEDGAYPEQVDAAMVAFGMAMGPFAVSDLAGLDIAWRTRQRLAPTRDPAKRYVEIADRLCEAGRFGRKTAAGWYRYGEDRRRPEVDPFVTALIEAESARKGITRQPIDASEIQTRALSAMIREARQLLAEGIAARPSDVDLVMVHGYGFPALKGGPLFWADGREITA